MPACKLDQAYHADLASAWISRQGHHNQCSKSFLCSHFVLYGLVTVSLCSSNAYALLERM